MGNDAFEKLLDPQYLKPRLIFISIYITTYELLKSEIIDRIKDFYSDGYDVEKGSILSDEYFQDLGLDPKNKKRVFEKSQNWLRERDAINDQDIQDLIQITDLRNEFAHNLSSAITSDKHELETKLFLLQTSLLKKIGIWWIRNVEMSIDPDAYPENVSDDDIVPGSMMWISILTEVALKQDEESLELLKKYQSYKKT